MNEKTFAKGFTTLCMVFNATPDKLLSATYFNTLKELSDQEFSRAVEILLKTHKYGRLPLPAEILEAVRGNPTDRAIFALNTVEKAVREIGGYKTVVFEDPVIHMVIESMGGWVTLCEMPIKEWKFQRQEFIKLYEAYSQAPTKPQPKLLGRCDIDNQLHGYSHRTEPVYIGDSTKKTLPSGQKKRLALTHKESK